MAQGPSRKRKSRRTGRLADTLTTPCQVCGARGSLRVPKPGLLGGRLFTRTVSTSSLGCSAIAETGAEVLDGVATIDIWRDGFPPLLDSRGVCGHVNHRVTDGIREAVRVALARNPNARTF